MKPGGLVVVGYGLLGRLLAWRASLAGHKVIVYEQSSCLDEQGTSFAAGGMLAPFSELDSSEDLIFHLGQQGLMLWTEWFKEQSEEIGLLERGSLIVAHPRDEGLWQHFKGKTCRLATEGQYELLPVRDIEPELSSNLGRGLYFPLEKHLEPSAVLRYLAACNQKLGVKVHYEQSISTEKDWADLSNTGDWTIDCRGLGAKNVWPDLRGVRGESLIVHAPHLKISRPVRLLHPRYVLYVVPHKADYYYLGASQIESESTAAITVQSAMELMSAAYTVHPGFAEASIYKTLVGLRPALNDHLPKILCQDRRMAINGLFRHGYLLGPVMAEAALALIANSTIHPLVKDLILHKESSKYASHC